MYMLYNLLIKYHMWHNFLNIDDMFLLSLFHIDHMDITRHILLYLIQGNNFEVKLIDNYNIIVD